MGKMIIIIIIIDSVDNNTMSDDYLILKNHTQKQTETSDSLGPWFITLKNELSKGSISFQSISFH